MNATVRQYNDLELIHALGSDSGLDPAVRFMYHQYFDFLSLYVMENRGSLQDAEDIFQEVLVAFIEVIRNGRFRRESSVKTFLFSLNRNIWLNELRKRGSRSLRDQQYERGRPGEDENIGEVIAARESKKQILEVIDRLGESCRKILLAFYYENLSMKEVLQNVHFQNEQVLRNKKYKCLKQLEKMLMEHPSIAVTLKSALGYE